MIVEAYICHVKNLLDFKSLEEISTRISSIFNVEPIGEQKKKWISDHLIQDKKNDGQRIKFALPEKIGQVNKEVEVSMDEVMKGIEQYNENIL
jgi:3-dehydroquinate synthetase